MKALVLVVALATSAALVSPVRAAVNVERTGAENPMVEVAKSTFYGGLVGLMLGGAVALASNSDDTGHVLKVGYVGGTFFGFAYGVYHVTHRPEPTGLLNVENGAAHLALVPPRPGPGGGVRLDLVSVRF